MEGVWRFIAMTLFVQTDDKIITKNKMAMYNGLILARRLLQLFLIYLNENGNVFKLIKKIGTWIH